MTTLKVQKYAYESGYRTCVLKDSDTGIPQFWPTLYITRRFEKKCKSQNSMKSALEAIKLLYEWADKNDVNIEQTILCGDDLSEQLVDDLCKFISLKSKYRENELNKTPKKIVKLSESRLAKQLQNGVYNPLPADASYEHVEPETFNIRLNYIASYIKHLGMYLSREKKNRPVNVKNANVRRVGVKIFKRLSDEKVLEKNKTVDSLKENKKNKTTKHWKQPKSLSKENKKRLSDTILPNEIYKKMKGNEGKEVNEKNPWKSQISQWSNFSMCSLMVKEGLRQGEVVNTFLKDIKNNGAVTFLNIVDRSNSPETVKWRPHDDSLKTDSSERLVPLRKQTAQAIKYYINNIRPKLAIPGNPYLFVSNSPISRGMALSNLNYLTDYLSQAIGVHIAPHDLRHTAVVEFRKHAKKQLEDKGYKGEELTEELAKRLRIFFGWALSSDMPDLYGKADLQADTFKLHLSQPEDGISKAFREIEESGSEK